MRVLITDEYTGFRDGLRNLLEARGIEVVGEGGDGPADVALAVRLRPEIVLLDPATPALTGAGAARPASDRAMEPNTSVPTGTDAPFAPSAPGRVFTDPAAAEFLRLLDGVVRHTAAPGVARERQPEGLTAREREVVALLVEGLTSNRELAERLIVSENTVKYHLRNILDKLHLRNRAQVVAYALRSGPVRQRRAS